MTRGVDAGRIYIIHVNLMHGMTIRMIKDLINAAGKYENISGAVKFDLDMDIHHSHIQRRFDTECRTAR